MNERSALLAMDETLREIHIPHYADSDKHEVAQYSTARSKTWSVTISFTKADYFTK